MKAQALLDRLNGVQKRSADQWSARCPAHDDHGPSLSIRELNDGRLLLHCFAGCSALEVLEALGMNFEDLFPEKLRDAGPIQRRRLITASQALELLRFEAILLAVVAHDLARGLPIPAETTERVAVAAGRISALAEEIHL